MSNYNLVFRWQRLYNANKSNAKAGIKMFKKEKPLKKPKQFNNYTSFDDFIQMMLTCSDEQFESTCQWLATMRKTNI